MIKILSRAAVKRIDAATVHQGVASINLMEQAAAGFVKLYKQLFKHNAATIVCGPGNNGGDGLAIARILHADGFNADVICIASEVYSSDFNTNRERLREQNLEARFIQNATELTNVVSNPVIIDALFGSGVNKPLTGLAADVVHWINTQDATRVSVDVPSGMFEQPHSVADIMVNADHVISFQVPRVELLLPRDGYSPASIHFINIGLSETAIEAEPTPHFLVEEADVKKIIRPRRVFDHKYTYGHALLVAGSRRTLGAALLATGGCLRSGCGLVTLHTVKNGAVALNSLWPEAMYSPDEHDEIITDVDLRHKPYTAIGIGCGIGRATETANALVDVLTKSKLPCVIDADALNILSEEAGWKKLLSPGSILTPHHKEFDRLVGEQPNDFERMQRQIELAIETKCVVIVKGAYTRIALPDGRCYFNSTGTPALATAGTGDVLMGLITGLVARGYEPADAAIAGVYIHGLAGQHAELKFGIECVTARDVIDSLPQVFKSLVA